MTAPVDWSRLLHAYGPATDTQRHLDALLGDDRRQAEEAENHLETAVLHQGFIYAATGPAAEWIAHRLAEDAFAGAAHHDDFCDGESLTQILLSFLGRAAESARSAPRFSPPPPDDASVRALQTALDAPHEAKDLWGDELLAARTWEAIHSVRAAAGPMYVAASRHLDSERSGVRIGAFDALAQAARLADDPDLVADGLKRLRARVPAAHGEELGAIVLALGELGGDTSEWLSHPDLPVRIAASWHRLHEPAGRRVMSDALMDPATFDAAGVVSRSDANACLAGESGATPEELLPVALAQVPVLSKWATSSWSPFLKAFRGTPELKPYLAALVELDDPWDQRNGSASHAFEQAGLPHDRKVCAAIAGVPVPGRGIRFWRR